MNKKQHKIRKLYNKFAYSIFSIFMSTLLLTILIRHLSYYDLNDTIYYLLLTAIFYVVFSLSKGSWESFEYNCSMLSKFKRYSK